MTNHTQNNAGNESDSSKKLDSHGVNDVPSFIVKGSSTASTNNTQGNFLKSHDTHQKHQAQQQQEHKQKSTDAEKTGVAQQGDSSLEQRKQQQQENKYQQHDQHDHLTNDHANENKNSQEKIRKQSSQNQQQQAQPQQVQSDSNMDAFKGKWAQQVGAAKIVWGKLTDDELLKSEGRLQKLAGLVQERYAISRTEADKQVRAFIEKCKC